MGRLITIPPTPLRGTDFFIGPASLMSSGRVGVIDPTGYVREYEQKYKVFTRHALPGPNSACYCPGLPLPYAFYSDPWGIEVDRDALAVRFQAKMMLDDEGAWDVWIVTVTFSNVVPEGGVPEFPQAQDLIPPAEDGTVFPPGMTQGGPNTAGRARLIGALTRPDMRAPVIKWDEEVIHRSPPKDLDGKAFVNAAEIPLSPAPVIDYPYNVLVVTRNEVNFDPEVLMDYAMVYNSDTFMKAPPGCAQCMIARPELKFEGRTYYHRVTYRIRFTPKIQVPNEEYNELLPPDPILNWPTRRIRWNDIESTYLNQGMHELYEDTALQVVVGGVAKMRMRAILDASGHATTVPRPLYGEDSGTGAAVPYRKGQAIPIHLLRDPAMTDHKPNYITYRIRESKPFAALFYRGLQLPVIPTEGVAGPVLTKPVGPVEVSDTANKYWLTPTP